MEPVEIERPKKGIAILRLNDPRHDNHLTEALCGSWIAALHRLAADSSLHVLLIRGLTKVFCAGASAEVLKQIAADCPRASVPIPGAGLLPDLHDAARQGRGPERRRNRDSRPRTSAELFSPHLPPHGRYRGCLPKEGVGTCKPA